MYKNTIKQIAMERTNITNLQVPNSIMITGRM